MSFEPPSYDSLFESSSGLPSPSSLIGLDPDEITQIKAMDSYRDLLTLPEDVVSQIFVHACQPILDPHSNTKWRRGFYPLWLGKICRAWRQSAWECSELWTTIVIRVGGDKLHTQIDLLRPWIKRARGRALDIYIEEAPETAPVFTSAALSSRMGILALLSRCSKQWRRIDMHLSYDYFSSPDIRLPVTDTLSRHPFLDLSLPLLQYASIDISNVRHEAELQFDLNHAPLLRTLSISYSLNANLLSRCPTKQITRLILNSCFIYFKDMFSQFPNLAELTWSRTIPVGRLPSVPVSHDHLQIFNIDLEGSPLYFFHALCLPALRSLSIRTRHTFGYTRALFPFFQQSGCALTRLTIECQLKSEHDLIDLLSSNFLSSSLQELYIRHLPPAREMQSTDEHAVAGLSRTFFDNLHPDEDSNCLTRLEILEYEGPLTVQAIDFIEPLIIRSRMRTIDSPTSTTEGMAILKRAKIKADQFSAVSEFSIAEYPDSQYVWEVLSMLAEGVLVLSNTDGSTWV